MKPGRNPRRAYDADGRAFTPPTVRNEVAAGFESVMAFCESPRCAHSAAVDLAGLPLDLPIPDIALRLRCSACGGQEIKIHINVHELCAMAWGGQGYQEIAGKGKTMLVDIVERIVALESGDVLKLTRDEIVEEFGRGAVGVACLQEMAEDHDCKFEVENDAVTITKF